MNEPKSIHIKGARVHNLRNIEVEIPHDTLTVITGLSGSGKSTLAFDTIFAEGQRRYVESLSAYARQFLGKIDKPDVDLITGIAPAIAIEQKVNTRNPRSTVGTTTEIYDYLKLLFARIGRTFSPVSGREVKCYDVDDVAQYVLALGQGAKALVAAPLVAAEGQGVIEADAAHGRRHPARAVRRPHTFHRGAAAGTRSRRPARRAVGDRRPPARRLRRGVRHAPARLRGPRVRLRRRRVPHPDRRESRGVFVALRGRRNRLRTAHRTPVQLQQPAGCLSPLRGLRQDHRHRRGSGHPRQEQDDLRRRHRLLARRDHAPVEGRSWWRTPASSTSRSTRPTTN